MHERQVARKCQHRREYLPRGARTRAAAWTPQMGPEAGRRSGTQFCRIRPARHETQTCSHSGRSRATLRSSRVGAYPPQPQTGSCPGPRRERPAKTTPAIRTTLLLPLAATKRCKTSSCQHNARGEAGKSVVDRQPSSLLSFLKIIFGFILCSQSLPDAALERLQAS